MSPEPVTETPTTLPIVLTLSVFCETFHLSYPTALRYIYIGELEARRIGGKWLITREAATKFISRDHRQRTRAELKAIKSPMRNGQRVRSRREVSK